MKETGGKKALLRIAPVAERLGISIPHAYRLAQSGELPCVRIGGAVRFEEVAVERFVREHRRGPKNAA